MNPEQAFHRAASSVKNARAGHLFGKACYKINNKAFCYFFQQEMVFKLEGDSHANTLALVGSKLFDPSGKGRPMKAWVQVSIERTSRNLA